MSVRPLPTDPPVNRPSDLAEAFGHGWFPYVPLVRARGGEASAAAPGGIPASLLVYPGPGTPAASGDATAGPRPDRLEGGPGGGGHPATSTWPSRGGSPPPSRGACGARNGGR